MGPHYASTPSTARRRHTFGSLPKVWVGGASHSLGSHSFTPPRSAGHPSLETLLPPSHLLPPLVHEPDAHSAQPPSRGFQAAPPFGAALSTARWRHTLRVPAKSVGWRGCLFFLSLHLFSGDFPHKLHRSASLLQRHIDGIPPRRKPLRHPLRRFLRCRSKRRVPHGAPADQCHSPSPAALAAASAWTASGSASATLAPSPLPSSATTICPCPCKDMQKPTLRSAAECEADRACQPGPFIPIVTPPVHFTRPLALHCPRFGHPLQPRSRRQRPLRRHLRRQHPLRRHPLRQLQSSPILLFSNRHTRRRGFRLHPTHGTKGSRRVRTFVRTLRATRIVRTFRGHLNCGHPRSHPLGDSHREHPSGAPQHVGILVRTLRGTRRDALRGTRTLRGLVSSRTSPPQWPLSAFGRLRTSSTSAISSACESSSRSPLLLMIRQSRWCVSSPVTP